MILLAGQIGLIPGQLTLREGLISQWNQIKFNFDQVLKEVSGNENLDLWKACLKAVLYVSKDTDISSIKNELVATFDETPLLVIRVHSLPKDAPIELEILASTNKYPEVECFPGALTLPKYIIKRFNDYKDLLDWQ